MRDETFLEPGREHVISHPARLPNIAIFGCGNVGLGMALALEARDLPLVSAWNRSPERAAEAAKCLRCPVASGPLPDAVSDADLILLAVSDDAVAATGDALRGVRFKPGATLAHMSGYLPASAMGRVPLHLGSLHPLLACPGPEVASRDLPSAFYAIEGDDAAVGVLAQTVDALGGRSRVMAADAKARYHAAGVLASNCVMGLLRVAVAEAAGAGLQDLEAPLVQMALGAVQKAAAMGISAALTGPVLRGDVQTVRGHMAALSAPGRDVYGPLTRAVVAIAKERGLQEEVASKIADAVQRAASAV